MYNEKGRDTLLILAVSSNICNKLDFEKEVTQWKSSGLLKPSVFKSAIATIEKESVIKKLGSLTQNDIASVNEMLAKIC
jgi:mRNA interferase MazF